MLQDLEQYLPEAQLKTGFTIRDVELNTLTFNATAAIAKGTDIALNTGWAIQLVLE
ncbi:hypothetical protein L798_04209 [Zootermopsis nevadensis]|uniref:Uncharacterized protein n=1 Tax=Zootermopsis nevadensis TaxID=136037 RepID=A0A067RBY8_ZOONE|nr:hypothetical protein L798_04209 [Zootermopsis nevadensis]